MLLLPITTRANFWATKFISFVVLEQLNIPNALRTMSIDGRAQARGGAIECLVPSRRTQACRRRGPAAPSAGHIAPPWSWIASFAPVFQRSLVKSSKGHCTRMRIGLKPAHHLQRRSSAEISFFRNADMNAQRLEETASYPIEMLNEQRLRSPTHGRRRHWKRRLRSDSRAGRPPC